MVSKLEQLRVLRERNGRFASAKAVASPGAASVALDVAPAATLAQTATVDPGANGGVSVNAGPTFDRKAYQRLYMREYRKRRKTNGEGAP